MSLQTGHQAAKLSPISPSHSPTTAHSRARTPEASSPVGSGGPQSPVKEKVTPPSPSRHSRIPSTGNRLTVMELAQALSDLPEPEPELPSPMAQETEPSPVESIARPRNNNLAMLQAEKRRSTYERYSAIILPPLKEEATPTPTPAGTLNRNHAPLTDMLLNGRHETEEPEPMEEIDIVEKKDDMVHFSTDGKHALTPSILMRPIKNCFCRWSPHRNQQSQSARSAKAPSWGVETTTRCSDYLCGSAHNRC